MFKKTPLILALATQAGAQVSVTPGDGTQIVTGTVETADDVTALFGPSDDPTNLHLTFNENVFSPAHGLLERVSHAGEITMVSTADGDFFRGPLFIYNSPKITINKTSSYGAVFFADGEEGDRFLDTEDRLQSSSRLGSIIVSNTGGSVIDVTGTSRHGFDSDHIVFESTAEDAATIKATNGRNFTSVAPAPSDQTFSPIRGGVDFEGVSQEPNTTDITIKGAKTAIDLDNTLLTANLASTSITGSVSLSNNAHAIFGGISDANHDALVAVLFKPEAYVDAEKLNSLEQLFNNEGWYNQSLTFKGTEARPMAIDLTNSHIIGNAVNIDLQAGLETGSALTLNNNSTAAFFSKNKMSVQGYVYISSNSTMGVLSQGEFTSDSSLSVAENSKLLINADSLNLTSETGGISSSGTVILNITNRARIGGGLLLQEHNEFTLNAGSVELGGGSINESSLNISANDVTLKNTLINHGTVLINADNLTLNEGTISNESGTTTINVDNSAVIHGGIDSGSRGNGSFNLTAQTLQVSNAILVANNASMNLETQTMSFGSIIENQGNLSITANSLTGIGENANLTSNGTTMLNVRDSIALEGYLVVQAGNLALTPNNLEIAGGVGLNSDTSLTVNSQTVAIGTGIENNGTLSITANSLTVTGENPMLVSSGSTSLVAQDSVSLGGNVLVKTGTFELSAPNVDLNGRVDSQADTTVTIQAQKVAFTQPFKNFGVLSITADSLVGTGDLAEFKSNGDTTITVAKEVVIGGELDTQAHTLTLTAESLQVNDLIHVHPDATLHITTKELSSANGINNHGALMTIQADTLKSNGLMIQGTTEINVAKDANLGRTLIVHAGSLDFTAGSLQVDGPVTVEPNTTLELDAKTMTAAGPITNQGGAATLTVDKLVAQQGA